MKTIKLSIFVFAFFLATVTFGQTGTFQAGNEKILKMRQITDKDRGVQWPPFGGLSFQIVTATEANVYGGNYEAIGFLFSKPELCKVGTIEISQETGLILLLYSADSGAAESGKITITKKNGNIISGTYEAKVGSFSFKGTFTNIKI